MKTNLLEPFVLLMAFCALALPGVARAEAEVPLQFEPPLAPGAWDTKRADSVVIATQVMIAQMDMGDAEVRAWVARIPGDPPPAGLYDDMDWPHALQSGYVMELDLGESLRASVDMVGEDFEARLGEGWITRAQAMIGTVEGRTLVRQEYVLMPDDGLGSLGVSVHSPFVDLQRLEVLEGTWVQIVRIRDEDF